MQPTDWLQPMPLEAEEPTNGAKSTYRIMGNDSSEFQDTVSLGCGLLNCRRLILSCCCYGILCNQILRFEEILSLSSFNLQISHQGTLLKGNFWFCRSAYSWDSAFLTSSSVILILMTKCMDYNLSRKASPSLQEVPPWNHLWKPHAYLRKN